MRPILAALALSAAALPASGQERPPEMRQSVVELAYVLGESHALRQACAGPNDQHWRTRMVGLVEAEQADPGLDRQMKEGFNAGFAARRSQFPVCTDAARQALIAAASRGQELASSLSRAKTRVEASPEGEVEGVTEAPPPR
jgi:uncharacterized protein (TIGR02301 family)